MQVKAHQGDTVDQLCQRHYGKTEGVTEKVLSANPGLSSQIFLNAGQAVEMPDEPADTTGTEAVQLWT